MPPTVARRRLAHHRHLVAGLDQADSTWDATKCSSCPASVPSCSTATGAALRAFKQDAPYLFDPAAPGLAEYDSGVRTIGVPSERRPSGYGVWSLFGHSSSPTW